MTRQYRSDKQRIEDVAIGNYGVRDQEDNEAMARMMCRVMAAIWALGVNLDVADDDEKGTPTPADPTPAERREGTAMERSMAGQQDKHPPHAEKKFSETDPCSSRKNFSFFEAYRIEPIADGSALVVRNGLVVGVVGPGESVSGFVERHEVSRMVDGGADPDNGPDGSFGPDVVGDVGREKLFQYELSGALIRAAEADGRVPFLRAMDAALAALRSSGLI